MEGGSEHCPPWLVTPSAPSSRLSSASISTAGHSSGYYCRPPNLIKKGSFTSLLFKQSDYLIRKNWAIESLGLVCPPEQQLSGMLLQLTAQAQKPRLRQNNLKISLFVCQAENQYFWGHSSVVLQFMAHFCYSLKVFSATRDHDTVWMWRTGLWGKNSNLYHILWFGIYTTKII